jgi:hypothetical protein
MPPKQRSGWLRLGIVLSFFWTIASPVLYFGGIISYPSFLTTWLSRLYVWIDRHRPPVMDHGIEFTPLDPTVDVLKLAAFILLPLLSGWLLLFVCPRLIRWVWQGFRQKVVR